MIQYGRFSFGKASRGKGSLSRLVKRRVGNCEGRFVIGIATKEKEPYNIILIGKRLHNSVKKTAKIH